MKKTAVDRRRARSWPRVRRRGQRADQDRRRRPDHRPQRRLRRAAEERRRAGGRGHQRGRRHQRPEDHARRRRRRLRSEAGRVGRQQVRRPTASSSSSATSTPASRSRPRKSTRKPASSRSPRPRPTRSSPSAVCGTPSAPAVATTSRARVAGAYLADNFKGKKVAIVHDKTPYGKGLADETKKAMNAKGVKEVVYEGVNTGEKDYSALVSKMKAGRRRRRLFRRPAHRSRPDHPPDARPGPQGSDDVR